VNQFVALSNDFHRDEEREPPPTRAYGVRTRSAKGVFYRF